MVKERRRVWQRRAADELGECTLDFRDETVRLMHLRKEIRTRKLRSGTKHTEIDVRRSPHSVIFLGVTPPTKSVDKNDAITAPAASRNMRYTESSIAITSLPCVPRHSGEASEPSPPRADDISLHHEKSP